MLTFCQRLYHIKCQHRGVGGQKMQKSGQRSLWMTPSFNFQTKNQILNRLYCHYDLKPINLRWGVFTWLIRWIRIHTSLKLNILKFLMLHAMMQHKDSHFEITLQSIQLVYSLCAMERENILLWYNNDITKLMVKTLDSAG